MEAKLIQFADLTKEQQELLREVAQLQGRLQELVERLADHDIYRTESANGIAYWRVGDDRVLHPFDDEGKRIFVV